MNDRSEQTVREVAPSADVDVTAMIILVDELETLIVGENRHLKKGLPASMSDTISRKTVLAAELEHWVKTIRTNRNLIEDAAPALRVELTMRSTGLDLVMAENATRLQGAITAARQRVEAVMCAIREQGENTMSYGANGHTCKVAAVNGVSCRLV